MPRDNPDWITERRRELSERIADLRAAAHDIQESLSETTGISHSTIQRIESGEGDPRYTDLLRIAAALGTRVSAITADVEGSAHPPRGYGRSGSPAPPTTCGTPAGPGVHGPTLTLRSLGGASAGGPRQHHSEDRARHEGHVHEKTQQRLHAARPARTWQRQPQRGTSTMPLECGNGMSRVWRQAVWRPP